MKKILLIILTFGVLISSSYAYPVKTTWVVEKYIGTAPYSKPEELVGKTQRFFKGLAEGAFFNCDYGSLVSNYATYTYEEFFNDKQFTLFLQQKLKLDFPTNKKVYVEKLTCADNKSVLFPFIQFEDGETAYYEFDMVIYQLKKE